MSSKNVSHKRYKQQSIWKSCTQNTPVCLMQRDNTDQLWPQGLIYKPIYIEASDVQIHWDICPICLTVALINLRMNFCKPCSTRYRTTPEYHAWNIPSKPFLIPRNRSPCIMCASEICQLRPDPFCGNTTGKILVEHAQLCLRTASILPLVK